MKKLRLDDLDVESFDTVRVDGSAKGTVLGHTARYIYSECYCESFAHCSADCPTINDYTCNGATHCGTCFEQATCNLQYGCGGTSFDNQMC